MKRRLLAISLSGVFTIVILSGYSEGPGAYGAGNRTGSPGSPAGCGSATTCHGLRSPNTVIQNLTLTDSITGIVVANGKYIPNRIYIGTLTATNSDQQPYYGFQLCCLKVNNTNSGLLNATMVNTHTIDINGKNLVEHGTQLPGNNGSYSPTFSWKAPPAGNGNAIFYCAFNAVNNNGDSTGDEWATPIAKTFAETPAAIENFQLPLNVSIYPNPVTDKINFDFSALEPGLYEINCFNEIGTVIKTELVNVMAAKKNYSWSIATMAKGIYFMQIKNDNKIAAFPITIR